MCVLLFLLRRRLCHHDTDRPFLCPLLATERGRDRQGKGGGRREEGGRNPCWCPTQNEGEKRDKLKPACSAFLPLLLCLSPRRSRKFNFPLFLLFLSSRDFCPTSSSSSFASRPGRRGKTREEEAKVCHFFSSVFFFCFFLKKFCRVSLCVAARGGGEERRGLNCPFCFLPLFPPSALLYLSHEGGGGASRVPSHLSFPLPPLFPFEIPLSLSPFLPPFLILIFFLGNVCMYVCVPRADRGR